MVYRWDKNGKLLFPFNGPHQDYINSLTFFPELELTEQRILTGSKDGTGKILTITGEEIPCIIKHKKSIFKAVFSPQKDKIITAALDGMVKVWDITGNILQQKFKAHKKEIYDLAIAPSGKYVLTASTDRMAKLWDLENTKNPIRVFEGHQYEVSAVAFSNEKERPNILTGSWDTTAKLWNWDGELIHTLRGHKDDIRSVAFSPDNQYLLTGSKDKVAKLWNLSGELIKDLKGHTKEIHEVIFTPDGKSVVTGSADGTAKIWEIAPSEAPPFKPYKKEVSRILFSTENKEILTAAKDKTIQIWDFEGQFKGVFNNKQIKTISKSRKIKKSFPLLDSDIFSPRNRPSFLTNTAESIPDLWDAPHLLIRPHKKGIDPSSLFDSISAIAFSADKKKVLLGFWDKRIVLWDLKESLLTAFPKAPSDKNEAHTQKILTAAFSNDGQMIVTGSQDESAILWKLEGQAVHFVQYFSHQKAVLATLNPTNARSLDPYPPDSTTNNKKNWVNTVAFLPTKNPEERKIVTGCNDGIARLWDLKGNLLTIFEGHSAEITTLTFSPDGQYLLTGSKDLRVKLWDLTGNEIQYYEGHKNPITDLSFLPDNAGFLTYSKNEIVKHLTPAIYLKNQVALCDDKILNQHGMEMPDSGRY